MKCDCDWAPIAKHFYSYVAALLSAKKRGKGLGFKERSAGRVVGSRPYKCVIGIFKAVARLNIHRHLQKHNRILLSPTFSQSTAEPVLPSKIMERKPEVDDIGRTMATQVADSSLVSRAYQIEMFEASLHGNTIVVVCQL
jgi:hypothetical protein